MSDHANPASTRPHATGSPPARMRVEAGTQPRYGAQYQSVSWLAVMSVICGVLSFTTVFGWYFILVPLAGIVLGWNARQRIRELPAELTGTGLAWTGMCLSLVIGGIGVGAFIAYELREVPYGYHRVTFTELQPDSAKPGEKIPPKAEELEGKHVFIKGFIYPGKRTIAIKHFVLVPTVGHCSFCSTRLKSTEMISSEMSGDMRTNYKRRLVAVGGTLTIDKAQAARPFGGFPYKLEVDYIR